MLAISIKASLGWSYGMLYVFCCCFLSKIQEEYGYWHSLVEYFVLNNLAYWPLTMPRKHSSLRLVNFDLSMLDFPWHFHLYQLLTFII
jgi:hypothetical protein